MSKLKIFGIAMAAGMMIAGCNKNESEEPTTVATVNGASLSSTELKGDVEKLLAAQGDKIPAEQKEYYKQMIRNQIVQSFIYENVLVAKAKALGVTVTDADRKDREEKFLKAVARMPDAPKTLEEHFQKFPLGAERARREFENGILIDKMIKAEAEKQAKGDFEKEAQKTIDEIIAANRKAEGSAAEALKKINDLKDQLAKVKADELPAKFAELAKANSDCPSKEKGGDLGAFAHGQMVKEFDEAAFKLPVGKLSEPVKTQFGYHLILTTKKFPAVEAKGDKPAEPEKVQASHILVKTEGVRPVPKKDEVVKFHKSQAERKVISEFVVNEVKKADITVADEFKSLLPPDEKPAAEKTPVETTAK